MHKRNIILFALLIAFFALFPTNISKAISNNVVISQIQLGNEESAKNEFIQIFNNNIADLDITNWCLVYQSSSLKTEELVCFEPENNQTHIFLPGNSTALAVSSDLSLLEEGSLSGDLIFSATLSGSSGYVLITDNNGDEIDKVGWGVATDEVDFIQPAKNDEVIKRKIIVDTDILQDTDIYSEDFEITIPNETYIIGNIFTMVDMCKNIDDIQESLPNDYYFDDNDNCMPSPVDVCLNLEGLQTDIPDGYVLDENNSCQIDICLNIEGIQMILPLNMTINQIGNCIEVDYCPNLLEIQTEVPPGYYLSNEGGCKLDLLELQINEILPSITGIDDGNEYIEIYNPNETDINLKNYMLSVGLDGYEKFYEFPSELNVKANEYYAIYNSLVPFTLKNTKDSARLYSIDNTVIGDTVTYENPVLNESWAKINNLWQYTNQLTPGASNLEYLEIIEEEVVKNTELVPCGPNQYRNPETNRCRNIAPDIIEYAPCPEGQERNPETNRCRTIVNPESVLVPCKDGQYRSEETNRCRNIAPDIIEYAPCPEGQERNPETNRCRTIVGSVLGEINLAPCPEGQERNPETNRCRKVVDKIPEVEYEVEPVNQIVNNDILWISLGGVGLVAICYGVWEWRIEIKKILNKIAVFIHLQK